MMKKQHGPALVRRLIPMTECPSCAGAGLIRGVFHQMDCIGCHGAGLVHAETLDAIPVEELVVQLGLKLRSALIEVEAWKRGPIRRGEAAQYQEQNRKGPGGSSYKGD